MSTINATAGFIAQFAEIFTALELPAVGEQAIVSNRFNGTLGLSPSSSPPVTMAFAKKYVGPQTLDLTAIARDLGANLDASGLRLQVLALVNLSTSADLVVDDPMTDPYPVNDGDPLTVPPGGRAQLYYADQLADVDSGAKNLSLAITGGESFEVVMMFG